MSGVEFWACTPRQFTAMQEVVSRQREIANERADFHAGVVASTIANVNRAKNQKAFKPADFMPAKKAKPKKRQTVEEQMALAKAITRANGGKVD